MIVGLWRYHDRNCCEHSALGLFRVLKALCARPSERRFGLLEIVRWWKSLVYSSKGEEGRYCPSMEAWAALLYFLYVDGQENEAYGDDGDARAEDRHPRNAVSPD